MALPLDSVNRGMAGRWTGSKRGLELRLVLGVLEGHANGISNEAQRIHFRARAIKRPHYRRAVREITTGILRPLLQPLFAKAKARGQSSAAGHNPEKSPDYGPENDALAPRPTGNGSRRNAVVC